MCLQLHSYLHFVQTKNETSAAQKPRIFVWTKGIKERATSSKVSAPLLPFWVLEKGGLKENLIGCYELLLRGRCFLNLWAVPKGFRALFFFGFLFFFSCPCGWSYHLPCLKALKMFKCLLERKREKERRKENTIFYLWFRKPVPVWTT